MPQWPCLYYNQHEFETECLECHISRYRIDQVTKKVPCKVLHYIPIIPCLQWLFRCKNIMQFMDYHAQNISQDDIIWIPIDGSTFRDMEENWPQFKEQPHNLRISLVADVPNPFAEMRFAYSVWHIFLINNNIHLCLSIKMEYIMLLMIILGMFLQ